MFGRKTLFLFIVAAALAVSAYGKTRDLKIVVERTAESSFKVNISFAGDASGTSKLLLPNEWGGQRELYKAIRNLTVSPAAAQTADTAPHTKTISHKAGESITLKYEIVQDFPGLLKNSVRYRPAVNNDFIHWIGNAIWVLPAWDDISEINATIEWKGFPNSWVIANSFASGTRKQKFKTRYGSLRQAIFVAGDFRLIKTKAADKPVNLAIRGKWDFTDAELAEMTRRVIEIERNFWNDHSQEYYLVTLVPLDEGGPNSISTGGTGLSNSFALFATPNARIDLFRRLLAHEYFHNWNSPQLGSMPDPEQQLYWFSEGFTDFYTYELLRRGGLITVDEYVRRYNELIREYYMLPLRTEPNERIVKDFWNDRNIQRLPYLRGFLFATNLNAEIKKMSGGKRSLDDAMFELFNASKKSRQPLSHDSLATLFTKYLGRDAAPMMKRFLTDGELISPDAGALGPDISLVSAQIPVFELGFDFDKFVKERIVSGVNHKSAAYAAGLRDGQQRNGGFSFAFGDTTREIELKVKDDDGEKTMKFLPVAKEGVTIPQYKIGQ